jgi:hypothetical protein
MSSANTPVMVNKPLPSVRVKKPVLSAKFSKFQVFGFWFIENMKNKQIIDDVSAAHSLLTMFSDVPQQALFFEQFLEEFKMANKNMKAAVRLHNKPPPSNKKEKKLDTTLEGTEKKRGRKRKEVVIVNDKQEQLIQDLVAAANGYQEAGDCAAAKEAPRVTEPLRTPVQEPKNDTKPKRKYVRKPKVDTKTDETKVDTKTDETKTDETKPSQIGETKVDETKPSQIGETKAPAKTQVTKTQDTKTPDTKTTDTKTQDTKTPDTKTTDTDTNDSGHQDEQELEIDVEPITIDGQHFLIDATHNLYHTQSFLPLGTFKNNSLLLH